MRIASSPDSAGPPGQYVRGVWWAVASAMFTAWFMIPWKLASQRGSASVTVFAMLVFATLCNGVLYPLLRHRYPGLGDVGDTGTTAKPSSRVKEWAIAAALAICTLLGNEFSARSITHVTGPVLSVLQRTEVVWIALLSAVALREHTNVRFWIGACLAGTGLWVLHDPATTSSTVSAEGLTYGLLSAVAFSVMAVITRRYIHKIHPVRLNLQRLLLALPLCLLAGTSIQELIEADRMQVLYASLAGLCGPVLSRLCLMQSAKYVPARISAITVQLAPLFTVCLSFLIFDELPAAREWVGGALMLLGVVMTVAPLWPRLRPS